MARVRVTLKPGVNDPQGLAIAGGLHSLGFGDVKEVRAGRYLEIRLDAADRSAAEGAVQAMCQKLLANPVIERYEFELVEVAPADGRSTISEAGDREDRALGRREPR